LPTPPLPVTASFDKLPLPLTLVLAYRLRYDRYIVVLHIDPQF
jgi:hypothetical protein